MILSEKFLCKLIFSVQFVSGYEQVSTPGHGHGHGQWRVTLDPGGGEDQGVRFSFFGQKNKLKCCPKVFLELLWFLSLWHNLLSPVLRVIDMARIFVWVLDSRVLSNCVEKMSYQPFLTVLLLLGIQK